MRDSLCISLWVTVCRVCLSVVACSGSVCRSVLNCFRVWVSFLCLHVPVSLSASVSISA